MHAYERIKLKFTKYLKSAESFLQPFDNLFLCVTKCLFFSSASLFCAKKKINPVFISVRHN